MNHYSSYYHGAAPERREVRPSSEAVDVGSGEQSDTNGVDRFVFTRIRVAVTGSVFAVSEVVRVREGEISRAATDRLSENAFNPPLLHTPPPGKGDPSRPLSDRAPATSGFRSAKERPLRATVAEQEATSPGHCTSRPSVRGGRLGVRTTTNPANGEHHLAADQASPSSALSTLTNLLSAAQQYLQALRECISLPRELREAWDSFYKAYDPLVRRTVADCGIVGADADDAVQEAWAEITSKLTRFEYDPNRGSFEGWLRIVVHRSACRHIRRDQRQTAGRIDTDLTALTCPRILGPAIATQREELRASVREALNAFRPRVTSTAFRILVLTTIQGQTSTEIGERLGISPINVRVTRHRTAHKFRQFVAARPALANAFGVLSPP